MPYATTEDLAVVWPGYSDDDEARANALIAMVGAALDRLCDTADTPADVLKLVTCRVVSRMLPSDDTAGVQSESWSATPFGGSVTFANPSGDIYLTSFERTLLGIDGCDMAACHVSPTAMEDGDV